jgi:membrane protein implicated in regulation of membrane protease activity
MYLIAIAWMYVVLMMAVAEALSTQGSVLGAIVTFVLYGLLPLSLVLYIFGTPARKRARKRAEQQDTGATAQPPSPSPDSGGHAPGDPVAAEREKP